LLNRTGPLVAAKLVRPGFFPAGGGCIEVGVKPAASLQGLELMDRGAVRHQSATVFLARLPPHIGEREANVISAELGCPEEHVAIESVESSAGPGNAVVIDVASDHVTEVFAAFGRRGVRAEAVAREAVRAARAYLDTEVPVGGHLADQLLLPMALAGGGSFRTHVWSAHAETNARVIGMFLDVPIVTQRLGDKSLHVKVGS
jgi:RNA 3'-terminal phosphate cyclase (ATP)